MSSIELKIITAEISKRATPKQLEADTKRRAAQVGILWKGGIIPIAETLSLPAFINHGYWVVKCPFCRGAELLDARNLFMCLSCFNAQADYQYIRVIVPEEKKRASIERILLLRPLLENRNWTPRETLARLKSENKLHGIAA